MANEIKLKRGSGSDPGASDLVVGEIAIRTDTGKLFTKKDDNSVAEISGGGISDGDKGDITVSGSGSTFTIDNGAVSYAKIQNVSATNRILGRDSSGAGVIEEITPANLRTMLNVADGATNVTNTNQLTNGAGFITATLTNEQVQDIVGGMVTGNTETGITVTYQDGDGTLDFVVGTLNQDTTGNAATATALETARNIGGVSFDGTGNINLPGVNTSGNQDTSGNAATATSLATARTIAGVSFDGTANISLNNNAITNGAGYITATLTNEQVQDIVGGMVSSNTETGISVTYQDGDGTLDFVVASQTDENFTTTLKNKLDGIAASATNVTNNNQLTNGAGYITATLTEEQVEDFVGGMVSGNTETGITVTYQDSDGTLDFVVASQTDENFTTTLKNKLDGIAASATNVTNNNQLTNGAGYITATLTNEQVQDIVGAMVSSNTETGITVTYQDGDGTLDFVVASQTDNNFTDADHSKLDGIAAGANVGIPASGGTFTGQVNSQNIIPSSNNSFDLGSSSYRFANLYVNDMHFANSPENVNKVDGTWGDWTLQEGENSIYMLNNRNGKKYKMNLTEIV